MRALRHLFSGFDIYLFIPALLLSIMGLVTMYSYQGDNFFFERQLLWILAGLVLLFVALVPDYRFLRGGNTLFVVYLITVGLLILLLLVGEVTLGAQRRFDLGVFHLQPSELAKLVLVAILAKYFAKRHEMIGNFKHIIISGLYAFFIFALIFIQPDFGSSIIIFSIWFGLVLVSGIKLKHLLIVFTIGALSFGAIWSLGGTIGLQDYQKQRIMTFLNPLSDLQGSGYHVYQSTIAVGSGELWGKGIGYGTQSKLQFLPEYETDFIFAAFAEEWGLVGVSVLFILFGILIWRLLLLASRAGSNFERLFTAGVAMLILSHFIIHVGMNIGILPVTGSAIPFLSYGGTHIIAEFFALGMVMAMRRYARAGVPAELPILEE